MTSDERKFLAEYLRPPHTASLVKLINGFPNRKVDLNTITEALVFYSALGKLPPACQQVFISKCEITNKPYIIKLLVELLKVQRYIGDSAVKEALNILESKQ